MTIFESILRGYPPPEHPWDLKLEPGGLGPVKRTILDAFWDHFGVSPGAFFGHFRQKMSSFCKLFLEPLPERLRDPFWSQKWVKSDVFWESWMCLKHSKYCTDLIFSCFLPDALPRPAPDLNFGGFGSILGPFWDPLGLHLEVCRPFFRQCFFGAIFVGF